MVSVKKVYLDNAATTPVDSRVLKAMLPYFENNFGNASSLHQFGLDARVAVDRAQKKIADFFACSKAEIYFTSGATESNNLAIWGLIQRLRLDQPGFRPHLIVSSIEHDAVLESVRALAARGLAEVSYLPVTARGVVKVEKLVAAVKVNTVLVSVMYVNNEIGTIQPIEKIGASIAKLNRKRPQKIYFHTDATQALNYCDCRVSRLGVDLLSFSGHKIYGPKGIGGLYLKSGVVLEPLFFGGHQQNNIRPGTYNVSGIVGLATAIDLIGASNRQRENQRIEKLRDRLIATVRREISGVILNGDLVKRSPNNANFVFRGVEGESLVLLLSERGIAVSTGSACSSGSLEPSHVLAALGLAPELAHGSLRVSLGRFNRQTDIDYFVTELTQAVKRLRKMSPL